MNQNAVYRAVAAATGESVRTIRDHGFSIADPVIVDHDPEPYGFEPDGEIAREQAPDDRRAVLVP